MTVIYPKNEKAGDDSPALMFNNSVYSHHAFVVAFFSFLFKVRFFKNPLGFT
jgi:hypothetical protein